MALSPPPAPGSGPVAVGFSGGLDSTVLLHLLAASPEIRARGLRALHVDHGLHPQSAQWARQCADVCATLDVEFVALEVTVRADGDGLEAAARAARYGAFAAAQSAGELIAVAHHRDDQAETVLLRLLRGAGDGVAAMRPLRPFGRGALWRPLLDVGRDAIAAYAQAQGLHWFDDPANAQLRHDRNYLRHDVLPRLAARWPHAASALARSAALLATQGELLAGEDARRLAALQGLDPATLDRTGLLALAPAWRDRVLRAWIAALELPPLPGTALATIAGELLPARADAEACVAWPGAQMRVWRDTLWAGPPPPELPADWRADWDGRAPLPLPTGTALALQPATAFSEPVAARARAGGERIVLPGRTHSHALKHVLQDLGVPPWQRAALPLLFAADGELLAAGDVAISARLQAWLDAHATCLRLLPTRIRR